jgi:hypothetical protein
VHFETARSWDQARALVTFTPRAPAETRGCALESIRVHVRDHRGRELAARERTLEAHYGRFVVSQCEKGAREARRCALEVSYGRVPQPLRILGRDGRGYDLGPEPPPDDIDGRSPAVVTWHDGDMHYFIASGELAVTDLVTVATSMY